MAFFLYSVVSCQGVFENPDFGSEKGEHNKANCNGTKASDCQFGAFAGYTLFFKESRFRDIRNRRRNKKDGNVDPIGGFANGTVVGVKKNRNQTKSQKNPTQLYAPKIGSLFKEKGLRDSEKKHRPKEQFHVFPSGFVHAREGCNPHRFPKPIIQKMQYCPHKRGYGKAHQLPKSNRSFHNTSKQSLCNSVCLWQENYAENIDNHLIFCYNKR